MSIKLVYVAGPYRAKTTAEVDSNIMRAREVGKIVASAGAYPIIPHANTAHFDGCAPNEFWLPATLEACRRCDAIVMCDGWNLSEGSVGERNLMRELGKRVFHHGGQDQMLFEAVRAWVVGTPRSELVTLPEGQAHA